MDQSPTLWRQSRGTWASTPSTFVGGVDGPGLDRSPTLRPPSQGTWAVPLCCQNLQKEKKCRTHLTTQSPAGIFIELSMKFPGARVPARKKNTCFRVVGALWLLHKLLPGTAKKIRGGSLGLHALTPPPQCGSVRPPATFVSGKFGPSPPHLANFGLGVRFVAFLVVQYPQSRHFLLLGRHLTRPLNLVDLGGLRLQDPFANLLYG